MFEHQNINKRSALRSIAIEKDVINVEVRGKGVSVRLKRWWHDLFLLSYDDNRSKHYYLSSNAMMMARTAQFHHERSSIHPFSKFSNFWNCLILHLLVIRLTVFHSNCSVITYTHIFFHYFLVVIEFMFVVDLYVQAKTGYVIERTRQVVMNPHEVLINFISTNAVLCAFTAIPLQTLMFLRLGKDITETSCRANLFVCTIRLTSLSHVPRLIQVSQYWSISRSSFAKTVSFKFVRITVVGLVVISQILSLTNTSILISAIITGSINEDTYEAYLIKMKYQHKYRKNEHEYFFYFMRLSRVFKNFFLFGFGTLPSTDISDQLTAILSYSMACLFHFWAVMVLYNCVARENSLDDRIYLARDQTFNVLRIRGLPNASHKKVVKYYNYKMSRLIVLEKKNVLFKALPNILKSEIKMACYNRYLEKIPCFSKFPPGVIAKLVELLRPEIYLDNDLVSSEQGPHDGLVIVEAGLLAVYSAGQRETGHLVDGDHFGEEALVDGETPGNIVVAVTASAVLLLDKIAFRKMMADYPDLFCSLRMETLLASVTLSETGITDTTGSTGTS